MNSVTNVNGVVYSGTTSAVKVAVMVPGAVTVAVVVLACVFVTVIPVVALHDVKW